MRSKYPTLKCSRCGEYYDRETGYDKRECVTRIVGALASHRRAVEILESQLGKAQVTLARKEGC